MSSKYYVYEIELDKQLVNKSSMVLQRAVIPFSWNILHDAHNGIDAINNENGKIEVALKQGVHYVKIHITDNGCGIPKKDWKNIFRPGFTTKNSGWGLGLSLCERIIKDVHGGKVSVLVSNISEGTTFEIAISKS